MGRERQSLGSISLYKRTNKHQVYFSNPLSGKPSYLGAFITLEEAQDVLNDTVFDFYNENSILLPKGIWVNAKTRDFRYGVTINGKNKHIFVSKNLKEVINARLEFITSLI